MIEYSRGIFGLTLLFRWNGSALIKAFIPGLISVILYISLYYGIFENTKAFFYQLFKNDSLVANIFYGNSSVTNYTYVEETIQDTVNQAILVDYLNHPYAIGVLVTSITLLITFRANYGYQRYWEGCTAVHSMMSKFMDATVHSAVFHLQSDRLSGMRPPSFYDWDELNAGMLTRDRERDDDDNESFIGDGDEEVNGNDPDSFRDDGTDRPQSYPLEQSQTLRRRRYRKSINETVSTRNIFIEMERSNDNFKSGSNQLLGPPRLDGGWGMIHANEITGRATATHYDINKYPTASRIDSTNIEGFASIKGGRTPSLFLQELAHLSSLLCAVAMTTLRNDFDDVESPLGTYIPGQQIPECDPLNLPKEVKRAAYGKSRVRRNLRYLLGFDQTKKARTTFNAARPMPVLGGVSDNEIAFLQRARGPYAKTQLSWAWISEFVIREHLAGSLGAVGPPIISRIIQFLSDGMKHYNEARRITWIPFPFVHAQLSAFFIFVVVVCIPFLMNQYANKAWLGGSLTFLVVTCLAGLHEVARELENPFRNAPNDIPLCTMMAQYNEALTTMYAGFHPDSYWDATDVWKAKGVVGKKLNNPNASSHNIIPQSTSDIAGTPGLNDFDKTRNDTRLPNDEPFPQSSDADLLISLRNMIDLQAEKIEELQKRIQSRERGSQMEASSLSSSTSST